jgi:hypothetical protein
MSGALMMTLVLLTIAGITAYIVGTMIRSISNERNTRARLWKNFGLSLGFCALFFISWIAHGVAEWQVFTDDQRDHNQPVEIGDFIAVFSRATLENWQSEFLQLFSFTVMAAVLIHKGSAESRDSDDLIQSALKRIEDQLGTEPTLRTEALRRDSSLHVLPDSFEGWMLKDGSSSEPEAYYDTQDEAVAAGRMLASQRKVSLVIHTPDGTVRDRVDRNR